VAEELQRLAREGTPGTVAAGDSSAEETDEIAVRGDARSAPRGDGGKTTRSDA
jgi:hypothetical protein